ncbi:hypothetical protein [Microbulbifer halophilus]|uniref:hypothetical protein n=1 Tax=Microbulbifer halophilus TaxID=453963 RepID=UPI00361B17C9
MISDQYRRHCLPIDKTRHRGIDACTTVSSHIGSQRGPRRNYTHGSRRRIAPVDHTSRIR